MVPDVKFSRDIRVAKKRVEDVLQSIGLDRSEFSVRVVLTYGKLRDLSIVLHIPNEAVRPRLLPHIETFLVNQIDVTRYARKGVYDVFSLSYAWRESRGRYEEVLFPLDV